MMAPDWASIDELLGDLLDELHRSWEGRRAARHDRAQSAADRHAAAADRSAAASDRFAAAADRGQSAIEREQAVTPDVMTRHPADPSMTVFQ
jgi:hypothetical protein